MASSSVLWAVAVAAAVGTMSAGAVPPGGHPGHHPVGGHGPMSEADRDRFLYGQFPKGFAWSVATAAYQIEGGWNEDGKGESIWDHVAHKGLIHNNDTGDTTCDIYHRYREDVRLLEEMGATHYRFSVSWPRIFPTGTGQVNRKGVDYYNDLINALLEAGIEPQVTIYHWDLPQALQDKYGGWLSERVVEDYATYARTLFQEFGDRVKMWITLNEPWIVAYYGYGDAIFAPLVRRPADGQYVAAHNLLRAHAWAYHIYTEEFKPTQHGQIGITLNTLWAEPRTESVEDHVAADTGMEFFLGWFANPVFGDGDYPEVMKKQIGDFSKQQGYNKSRLPEFTEEEKQKIKGTSDFFGLNFYTS